MLAEQNRRGTKGIGQGDEDDVPVELAAGHDEVGPSDHERPPDENHGGLSQPDILERPGVEKNEESADAEQGQGDEARFPHEVAAGGEGDEAADRDVGP